MSAGGKGGSGRPCGFVTTTDCAVGFTTTVLWMLALMMLTGGGTT